ncbi:MAG: hypothetical protein ABW008_12300 [Acidimicrobiales bacterium]
MSDLLVALFSIAAVIAVAVIIPIMAVRWRLRRRNRVHPNVPSPAPLTWLVAPSTPARLHRRLQVTVRVASTHTGRQVPLAVAEHAVELDRRVVLAARQPYGTRGALLRDLRAEADELDRLAMAVRRPLDVEAVGDPYERLATLAEAHAELDAIDHTRR